MGKLTNKGETALSWLCIMLGAVFMLFAFGARAEAATEIFRSVGVGDTAPLDSGLGIASLDITGSTATFGTGVDDKVGVGDVIVYDANIDETLDSVAFIHSRDDYIGGTEFTVKTVTGGEPSPTVGFATGDWYIYRAYTSLENAEAGVENDGIPVGFRDFDTWVGGKNLVSADQVWNIACYANGTQADTTAGVDIFGWTTDNTRYIRIFTPQYGNEAGLDQRHSGVWDDSKYHLVSENDIADSDAILINGLNVEIDGLQIHYNELAGANWNGIGTMNVDGTVWIHDNIVRAGADGSVAGIALVSTEGSSAVATYKVWNNIVYDFWDYQIKMNDVTGGTAYVYNNTVYGNSTASCYAATEGTMVAINNIAQDCAYCYLGMEITSSDYNLADVALGEVGYALGAHSVNGASLTFEHVASRNFHLFASGDTAAIGTAKNLSGDSHISFADDIDDNGRTQTWDMGADEIPDSTAPTILSVTSNKANGTYGLGEVIDIDVQFSEPVYSSGVVTVTLETGATDRTCTFSMNFSATGTCNYTVQAGDLSADLNVSSIAGEISDEAGNPLTDFVPVTNLAAGKDLVINSAYVADTSTYVPTITINGAALSLGSQATFYQRSATLSFSGKQTAVAGGTVRVYRRSKLLKKIPVDANGNWAGAVRGLKNKVYLYKFAYLNAAGATVSVSPYYRIYVDTKKPQITNRSSLTTRAGAAIRIRTKDKTPITEYTYTFNGQTSVSTSPYFTVPADTLRGTKVLVVRVKDTAGNYSSSKRIKLRVR